MKRSVALALAAGLAGAAPVLAVAADPLPTETHKVLPADLAVEAAQAAIAACKAQGYHESAAIMDRNGMPQVLIVGDGASPLSLEIARRKAYTAVTRKITTREYGERLAQPGAFNPGIYDPELTSGLGGLPIKVGDDTIGGLGASGAPGGDKDEACAKAGLAKISDRLN